MKRPRLGFKLVGILVRDRFHHSERLAAETGLLVARFGTLLLLYRHLFGLYGGEIHGITFQTAAWSMFAYFAFSSLRLREVTMLMIQDIRSGHVEVLLGKPVSYLAYRFWWQVGSGLYPAAVITALGSLAIGLWLGLPPAMTEPHFLPTLLVAIGGGIVLSLLTYALVGLLAFWIEDATPVYWVVDKTVMILGGSYLPIALFPAVLHAAAIYSPFGASQLGSHAPHASWAADWPRLLGLQFVWILILAAAVSVVRARAERRLSVNGG